MRSFRPRSIGAVGRAIGVALAIVTELGIQGDVARADEASGTWTGGAELRTLSYREANTSILAPLLALRLDAPSGTTLRGAYVADVITSASVSVDVVTGASVTYDPTNPTTFHEARQEGVAEVLHGFVGPKSEVGLVGGFRTSHERDYASYQGWLGLSLALDERNLALRLQGTFLHDDVRYVANVRDPATDAIRTVIRELPGRSDFDGGLVAFAIDRVLDARTLLTLAYDFGYLGGYLGSPYRYVQIDSAIARENVPDRRVRHSPWVQLRVGIPRAHAAFHALVRGYFDDWGVHAFAGEVRWYQEIGAHVVARARYRAYVQTGAFFDAGYVAIVPTYPDGTRFATSNPRYAAMQSHEVGLGLVVDLGFLDGGRAPWLWRTYLEFGFDFRAADNRYGDAFATTFAIRVPFR